MSSGLFSIARGALLTHQTALQTISQNIANAETPGYSRQEAQLVSNTAVRMSFGSVGTGVHIDSIVRKRNMLLDENYRASAGQAGESELRQNLLGQLEGVFGEPTEAGMSSALDKFWSAWSDLASSPTSGAAKAVVQQSGRQLSQLFNNYDTQLTQQRTASIEQMSSTVADINSYAKQVADLNGSIVIAESNGHPANDLRDQRDVAVDKLATLAGARTLTLTNGSVSVLVGNSTLVDGNTVRPLSLRFDAPPPPPAITPSDIMVSVRLGNSPDRLTPLGGELKALVEVSNTDIPNLRKRLDTLASSVVTAVNTQHTAGYLFNGNAIPGTAAANFFDAGTLTNPVRGGTIRLDTVIANDASQIVVSGDANAPTDNSAAQALSGLRTATNTVNYTSLTGGTETSSALGFFRTTISNLGSSVKVAQDDGSMFRTLADQGEARRQSVSGVSVDEELVNMMRVQQSYTAATKLIKTADEMLQTLLQMV